MIIVLVCNSLGGGGAERVHVNLANGFAEKNHDVYLIADIYQKTSYHVDARVHVLPLCPKATNKFSKWSKALMLLRKYIKKHRPDVVIGNMHLCSLLSRFAAIGTKTPVIMTIHHALESQAFNGFSKTEKFLDRYSPSLYAATIVLTHADKLVMNNQNHHSKRIYVIPNPLTFVPVTIAENGKLKNVTGQELKKENIVLAAGRLNDWNCKGWDLLIQAAAKLKALFLKEGWRIEIAGGGTETMQMFLEKMCVQAGVEEFVQFLGYRTDMKELFQKSSVFCLSSRSEGLPMVLIEAMSQGCAPVACENLGRTKEIVSNDDEGLLFQTADVNDLARKLSQMIENNEYRKIVQRAAVRRSDFFNIEHVISIWENVLKDVCKAS